MTLQEHIDALDRMVTHGSSQPETRSQIAFIAREVAALEADYVSLSNAHAKLKEEHAKLQKAHLATTDRSFPLIPQPPANEGGLPSESCL